jgi:hypothetical protein
MIELKERLNEELNAEIYGDDPDVSGTIMMMIYDVCEELEEIGHIKGDGKILEKGIYEDAEVLWSKLVYLFSQYGRPTWQGHQVQLKADHWLTKKILENNPSVKDYIILF